VDDPLDLGVRQAVYDGFINDGRAPTIGDICRRVGAGEAAVRAALRRLAGSHALVLQPESGEVLMANPFSAVPTAFAVGSHDRSWWGNCIWDGLGILAMLGADGSVATACPDCGEALTLRVRNGLVEGDPSLAHFAVPAREWWQNIVFA
jgi:hypothetical protein